MTAAVNALTPFAVLALPLLPFEAAVLVAAALAVVVIAALVLHEMRAADDPRQTVQLKPHK